MPDADANFGVSLDLDFSTWWRHVKTIYWNLSVEFLQNKTSMSFDVYDYPNWL